MSKEIQEQVKDMGQVCDEKQATAKLSIRNIVKQFDKKGVLNGVSFDLMEGEFLSILGPSGCGKTTLIRILIGLEKADSGEILKGGEDISKLSSFDRGMGIVFQNYALFPNMTVLQNVEYSLTLNKTIKARAQKTVEARKAVLAEVYKNAKAEETACAGDKTAIAKIRKQTKDKVNELTGGKKGAYLSWRKVVKDIAREIAMQTLEHVGLTDQIHKRPSQLSGGQQQRVAIARTLATNPDVMLLDEPISALDLTNREIMKAELKSLQKKFGVTTLFITHDQEEAFFLSDRIMVMNEGNIEQIDTPENIYKHPASAYVKEFVVDQLDKKYEDLLGYTGRTEA